VKDDLIKTLEQLVLHKDKFDYILIETTGMANPGPLITSFWTDQQLGSYLKLDGVICVVDSANIVNYLNSPDISFEVTQQICYADRILLNKADLVPEEKVIEIRSCLI
jgi:G3E family GTPase